MRQAIAALVTAALAGTSPSPQTPQFYITDIAFPGKAVGQRLQASNAASAVSSAASSAEDDFQPLRILSAFQGIPTRRTSIVESTTTTQPPLPVGSVGVIEHIPTKHVVTSEPPRSYETTTWIKDDSMTAMDQHWGLACKILQKYGLCGGDGRPDKRSIGSDDPYCPASSCLSPSDEWDADNYEDCPVLQSFGLCISGYLDFDNMDFDCLEGDCTPKTVTATYLHETTKTVCKTCPPKTHTMTKTQTLTITPTPPVSITSSTDCSSKTSSKPRLSTPTVSSSECSSKPTASHCSTLPHPPASGCASCKSFTFPGCPSTKSGTTMKPSTTCTEKTASMPSVPASSKSCSSSVPITKPSTTCTKKTVSMPSMPASSKSCSSSVPVMKPSTTCTEKTAPMPSMPSVPASSKSCTSSIPVVEPSTSRTQKYPSMPPTSTKTCTSSGPLIEQPSSCTKKTSSMPSMPGYDVPASSTTTTETESTSCSEKTSTAMTESMPPMITNSKSFSGSGNGTVHTPTKTSTKSCTKSMSMTAPVDEQESAMEGAAARFQIPGLFGAAALLM
ncbi:hypothetical protein MBLNU230_g3602t1 [Neophaeotheca triangularis]